MKTTHLAQTLLTTALLACLSTLGSRAQTLIGSADGITRSATEGVVTAAGTNYQSVTGITVLPPYRFRSARTIFQIIVLCLLLFPVLFRTQVLTARIPRGENNPKEKPPGCFPDGSESHLSVSRFCLPYHLPLRC